jgi:molecular chaperone DnaK (HSP70)
MNTISIDFGTSYTSAAWLNPATGQPEAIRFIENGKEKIPSLVYYPSSGDIVIGEAALAMLTNINDYPTKQRLEIQASMVSGLKRRLQPDGRQALSGRLSVSHAEIISEIFKK